MRYLIVLFLSVGILSAGNNAIVVEKVVDQRASVAVVNGDDSSALSKKVHAVFLADLKISGNFKPDTMYSVGSYDTNSFNPKFRTKSYVLKYRFTQGASGAVLFAKLLNAGNSSVIMEKRYSMPSAKMYPFMVHKASTDINAKLGYKSLAWINRFVVFSRAAGRKQSEILLADYTFNYTKTILKGGLNIFPQWASDAQNGFYYTYYEGGDKPTLYYLDIHTGQRRRIVSSQGMLTCSDVSKDGNRLLLTMAPNNQPDIYEYNVATGAKKRLTTFSGIDVNGKYSDNGRSLTFVSNRLGNPNIYKKNIGSSAVRQIIFHGKKNNSCDTSRNKIVYSSKEGSNQFNIYLANASGGGLRPLTSMGVNQFPRFAPDGNTVLYIKRSKGINSIGYIGLHTNIVMSFPLGNRQIKSIDW